jgi:hypothetical protein
MVLFTCTHILVPKPGGSEPSLHVNVLESVVIIVKCGGGAGCKQEKSVLHKKTEKIHNSFNQYMLSGVEIRTRELKKMKQVYSTASLLENKITIKIHQ